MLFRMAAKWKLFVFHFVSFSFSASVFLFRDSSLNSNLGKLHAVLLIVCLGHSTGKLLISATLINT